MKIINQMRNYICEEDFKLIYINKKVNIVNYESILHFDNEVIIVKTKEKTIEVRGKNLVVSKLISDELLINGDITKIEFR